MRKLLGLLALICPLLARGRFFDACPGRRSSIGACLAGLCPAGSECINGYCCKFKTPGDLSEESDEYGVCSNGRAALGECIANSCPKGYVCEDDKCCKPGVKPPVTMIPVEVEVTKKTTKASTTRSTTTESPDEVDDYTTTEMTEIESIKSSFTKKSTTRKMIETTTTTEEDYEVDEKEIGDREEIDDITTSTTTTTAAASSAATKRKKNKKPIRTTTTPIPEAEEEEEEEEEETSEQTEYTTPTFLTTTTFTTTTADNTFETGCPVGEPIGECISDQCPEGHACYQNLCCISTPHINCTDVLKDCMSHLCNKRGYREFMTKNCARSCARCHLVDIDKSELRECRDRRSDCNEWAKEGFCDSTLYSTRQKLKFCGKSCKLC